VKILPHLLPMVLALVVCLPGVAEPAGLLPAAPTDWPQARLPADVVPQAYRLDLTIVPDQPAFSGRVEIDLSVAVPLTGFWIHGRDLRVLELAVTPAGGEPVAGTYTEVGSDGVAWVALADELAPGSATLEVVYDANFDSGLFGLYRVDVGADAYAFTQFESTFARKAFPGFDEPVHKTPFSISVTTRAAYRALSNTRVIGTEALPDEMQRLRYATTEPLPTYLIAFAVGPLDVVEYAPVPANEFRETPLPLRGVAARNQGERLEYALANTAAIVTDLEGYFGRAYPFDKLDIVAVPDFAGGAMENAGLITYRESLLLFDDTSPVSQRRYFGLIHAHELGHQWFGNLVTMPWWDDIWLNEAFASWIQARTARNWRPEFHYRQSVQSQALRAMTADSLVSARQIREPVESYDEIVSAFDAITYQKGAAVLQMFERYLGADTFQAGIQAHIRRFEFGSATVYDLMDSLESAAGPGVAVREPFESFLFQPGLPYVELSSRCSDRGVELELAQTRYLPAGSAGNRNLAWQLPVCLGFSVDGSRQEHCLLLKAPKQAFTLPGMACPEWILPNAGGAGYYRWLLQGGMEALAPVFFDGLDGGERLTYVDSIIAGVNAGQLPPGVLLDQLATIARAPERYPVTAAVAAYQQMLDALVDADQRQAANRFGIAAFGPRLEAVLSADGALSASDATLLKATLTGLMALWLEDADTRDQLRDAAFRFVGYPDGTAPDAAALDPDLLPTALTVAVQTGGRAFTEFLIAYIRNSGDARIRQAAVRALAYASQRQSLELARTFALSGDLRGNEFQTWAAFLMNPGSRAENWPWIQSMLPEFMAAATRRVRRELPLYLSRGLCSQEDADTLRALFDGIKADFPVNPRRLNQAVETAQLCAALQKAQAGPVNEYFARSGNQPGG